MHRVVIVGGGFAGLNCAKRLGNQRGVEVTLLDKRNHHLFQPLLYQVATAGLSPADIARPIRSLLAGYSNVQVVLAEVHGVDLRARKVESSVGDYEYDYLVMATGAQHSYFGQEHWERHAPGLKTLEQATEIRRRVLSAFEKAECESNPVRRRALLTFVVVGGGPTGVELAGAVGEVSRFTLARDFKNIDPKLTRIVLLEAGPRILPQFDEKLASRATRELEALGVQVWTSSRVTRIVDGGVHVGDESLKAKTVLWAAGVQASALSASLSVPLDPQGRALVLEDLSLPGEPNVFVLGDQANFQHGRQEALPAIATVALQQGKHTARNILSDMRGKGRKPFLYWDKGQMAAIGRRRAIVQTGKFRAAGRFAWLMWLVVHIYFLSGFKNRMFVLIQWAWSYLTFARGARLIVDRDWRSYASVASLKRSPKPRSTHPPPRAKGQA